MAKTNHNNGGGAFTYGRKRALGLKMATKHPVCHRKIEGGVAKKLANPCGRKIITKTAKTVHLRHEQQIKWEIPVKLEWA
jgi:hypothetical protein